MIVKRDLCICGEKQKPKETHDQFKTIICENCLEVISYEKTNEKRSKSKSEKEKLFLVKYINGIFNHTEYSLVKANSFEEACYKIDKESVTINTDFKNLTIE